MLNLIKILIPLCITIQCNSQNLKGTCWVNYFHMLHGDTIEFIPSSFIDSIYSEVHDDYHYGWSFLNDSIMDITKEHYFKGTKEQLDSRGIDSNFFDPPKEQIKVNVASNSNATELVLSLHTWDHVQAKFVLFNDRISLSKRDEKREFIILDLSVTYLRVVMIK